jgi:hypothetical protein
MIHEDAIGIHVEIPTRQTKRYETGHVPIQLAQVNARIAR